MDGLGEAYEHDFGGVVTAGRDVQADAAIQSAGRAASGRADRACRRQNTKAAKAKRLADAEAKRAEAEARMGRPHKTRSDKGGERRLHSKK